MLEKDWDEELGKVKRTHPNSKRLNNFLMKRVIEVNDITFQEEMNVSSRQLKKKRG